MPKTVGWRRRCWSPTCRRNSSLGAVSSAFLGAALMKLVVARAGQFLCGVGGTAMLGACQDNAALLAEPAASMACARSRSACTSRPLSLARLHAGRRLGCFCRRLGAAGGECHAMTIAVLANANESDLQLLRAAAHAAKRAWRPEQREA